MNDPHALPLAAAAALGAIVATTARLLPETIDLTFIPAAAAIGSGAGIGLGILVGGRAVVYGMIGAVLGAVVYFLALLGLA